MTVRIPPNNVGAEVYVLSSMILVPDVIQDLAFILAPDDFYRPEHREIYAAVLAMHERGEPVDAISLAAELTKHDIFDRIGGNKKIAEIITSHYTSVNAKHHAEEIRQLSEKRQLISAMTNLLQCPDMITAEAVKSLAESAEASQYSKSYTEKSTKSIEDFIENLHVKPEKIKSGFKTLDFVTGGFRVPSVGIIAAYPSVGKTAFALNIAANQEKPVVFFSLEMSCDMIYERMAAYSLKIDYDLFKHRSFTDGQYNQIKEYAETLKVKGFYVFDNTYFVEQQASVISAIKPGLVIVDYVQKVKTQAKTESIRVKIGEISGMYKQIARNNNCAILLLSQFSRPPKDRKEYHPTFSDLKESSDLEQDGDYIGVLHRPYVMKQQDPGTLKEEDGYIAVSKNKFGRTGRIDLFFNGRYQQFYEIDKTPPIPEPSQHWSRKYKEDNELPF